jgi:hypothetical protein
VLRLDHLAGLQGQPEVTLLPADRGHLGVEAGVDLADLGDALVPGAEHVLARALDEAEIAAQRQVVRRRHDVLALLVLVDRVREVRRALEQHVRDAALGGARSGAQPAGSRADDRDGVPFRHILNPLVPPGRAAPGGTPAFAAEEESAFVAPTYSSGVTIS